VNQSRAFSATTRTAVLQEMAAQELDLLVIGGGITGAGIALDASSRGMRVGLVEKQDFGAGTSSRSTKLIHGGLRYLKQGEVGLVREVGRERALLYRNAPHLVIPSPMLLPIYKGGTYGYLASAVGLYLYDRLAGVARTERRRMLGRKETLRQEPLLRQEGLVGGGLYVEYRTDDARLTLDILKTAWNKGALAVNHAEVTRFLYRGGKVTGVCVTDHITGECVEIRAKQIVNAAGPWVDLVRQLDGSLAGKRLFLTKGVHLVVEHERLPVRQSAYFDTPDGRMVFVIPRGRITYIGTTDTPYEHEIDQPRTTAADRDYLLQAVNAMFPEMRLTAVDVRSHWAGLRPLIYEEGKGPSELSRKDEIFLSPTGLITIAGGKLTGFRKMAEKVVNLVANRLEAATGRKIPACQTAELVISGGERMGHDSYSKWRETMRRTGLARGIDQETVEEWLNLYGTNTLKIYERLGRQPGPATGRQQLLRAQLAYAIEEEMTVRAVDFLRQRTGWTFFRPDQAEARSEEVVQIMAELLGWSKERQRAERQQVAALLAGIRVFPEAEDTGKNL